MDYKKSKFLFMYSSEPVLGDDFIAQPLGILYLGSILKAEGVPVKCIDERVFTPDEIRDAMEEADVVGISVMTPFLSRAVDWGKYAKSMGKVTMMGGGHAAVDPDSILDTGFFDFVFIGEAEITIREAIPLLHDKEKLKGVKGLGFFDDEGKKCITERRPFNKELEDIPYPAREMLPIERYFKRNKERLFYIFSSRGCPYSCVFCQKEIYGRKFRARSNDNVCRELELLKKEYNPGAILFIDELFTCDRSRVIDLCKAMIDRKLKLNWCCETRVDRIDLKMMRVMYKAGMRRMYFGVESGSPQSLKTLNKRFTVEQVIKALKAARRANIWTKIFLIVGTPRETNEDFKLTAKMLRSAHPDMVRTALFNPLIGSPSFDLYRDRIDFDRIFKDFVASGSTPYRHENFTIQELNEIDKKIVEEYEAWYFRPAQRLKRKLWRLRFFLENPGELLVWLSQKLGSRNGS